MDPHEDKSEPRYEVKWVRFDHNQHIGTEEFTGPDAHILAGALYERCKRNPNIFELWFLRYEGLQSCFIERTLRRPARGAAWRLAAEVPNLPDKPLPFDELAETDEF
jgi:hypothetical protein